MRFAQIVTGDFCMALCNYTFLLLVYNTNIMHHILTILMCHVHVMCVFQELRCKEDELKEQQQHQRQQEESLKKREKELDAREMELLGRELNIMITQNTPTPKKRKGKFSKTKLRVNWRFACFIAYGITKLTFFCLHLQLLKQQPSQISFPLDFRHTITVKNTALRDESRLRTDTPPGSPAIAPRLQAIAREWSVYSRVSCFVWFLINPI